jgi:acetyl esterase/lipase
MRENDGYFLGVEFMSYISTLYTAERSEDDTNPLAWPYYATVDDLHGLPPHVISVNELDPLRDEGLEFHQKLLEAGVDVDTRTVKGTTHAAELWFPTQLPEVFGGTMGDIKRFADRVAGL